MKWASVLKEVSETITCFCALCFAKGGIKFTAFLRYLTLKNPLCSQSNFVDLHSIRRTLELV